MTEAVGLQLIDLAIDLRAGETPRRLVDGVSLEVGIGRVTGIAGETGSGKTLTALAILALLERERFCVRGRLGLLGEAPRPLEAVERGRLRAATAWVPQDPRTALNPVMSIGRQLEDALLARRRITRAAARDLALDWLQRVGFNDARRRFRDHPHQLSGGELQRVLIALALAREARILVADEPTSALDVTVQAAILDLLEALLRDPGLGVLLITHDLRILKRVARSVIIMFGGRVVERGTTDVVLRTPVHPYTRQLLAAAGLIDGPEPVRISAPPTAAASEPDATGCPYRARCPLAEEDCKTLIPSEEAVSMGHRVACPPGLRRLRGGSS